MARAAHPQLFPFRGASWLMSWSLAARLHVASTTIAVTLLVASWENGYAWAGATVAGLTVGQGIAGPLNGRLVDRFRPARVLTATALGYGLGLGLLASLPPGGRGGSPLIALLVGVLNPPASQLARRTWSRSCTGEQLERIYRLEASGQEVLFMVSPILVASVGVLLGGAAALLTVAVLAVGGNLGFAVCLNWLPDAQPADTDDAVAAEAEQEHATRWLAAIVVATALVMAAITTIDLALVAWAQERGTPVMAGVFAAAWALGSLVGGTASMTIVRLRPGAGRRLVWMAVGMSILVPVVPWSPGGGSPWLVCAALLLGGVAIAPAFAALYAAMATFSSPARRGEAFGWQAVGVTVGAAMAAPLAGWMSDVAGPRMATIVAIALCASACLLLLPLPAGAQARALDQEGETVRS